MGNNIKYQISIINEYNNNMKFNKYIIFLLITVLISTGLFFVIKNNPIQTSPTPSNRTLENTRMNNMKASDSQSISEQDMVNGSKYVIYTPEVLANNKNKRRVLFFYANWCPICKPADANFKQNVEKIPVDVVLIRVNYDDSDTDENEKELAKRYNVSYQHTFVQINSAGKQVAVWNSGQIEELLANLK